MIRKGRQVCRTHITQLQVLVFTMSKSYPFISNFLAFEDAVIGVTDDYIMYVAVTPLKSAITKGFVQLILSHYNIPTPVNVKPKIGIIERVSDRRYDPP